MELETVLTCPLGSKCKEIKDGKIHQCRWFVVLDGKNPQSEEIIKEGDCAIKWLPLLQIENTQKVSGVQAATESFRNEVVDGNAAIGNVMLTALRAKQQNNLIGHN